MFNIDDESDWKKTKTSDNFSKKILSKKRQFSNDFYGPETLKDFTRFIDIININTFGSQPIVIYKKIKRSPSPINPPKLNNKKGKKSSTTSREKIQKNTLKNNYVCDGGLQQKINKYKNKLMNNHFHSPSKKIANKMKSKTNREPKNNLKREKTQKMKIKTKEYIPKTTKETSNNFRQIFKKAKTTQNTVGNAKIKKKNPSSKSNNKYMSDKNTIENEEKKKNDNINNLINNVVTCYKKEYIKNKKNFGGNKITDKKIDYLLENGIDENYENQEENGIVMMNKSEDKTHFKIKKIKPPKKMKIDKINTNNINNMNYNLHTDNDKFIYNNLTNSNNNTKVNEFSKILIKSKIMSSNIYEIKDNKNPISNNKKKNIYKPQINQFEFLEKIRCNFKKIKKLKKEKKELPELLNDSFRFTHSKNYKIKNKYQSPEDIPYDENEDKEINGNEYIQNDEYLYADRVTHRTHNELNKFLKKKKLEKKKEQKEEIKKKQEKIMNTLQNLIRLGEQCKTNNSPNKNRIDSKNHLKQRKVLNEYYIGTEESKNNTSTFIDKTEFYKSILESKNVLINSKIEKTESNIEDNKNNLNNARNIIISNSIINNNNNVQNIMIDNNLENNNIKNNIIKNYNELNNNYKDKKLEELKEKVSNTIKRSNELFNKENMKRIKSDLSDNTNNSIKIKLENKYFIKNINNNINKFNIKKKYNNIDKEIQNKINKLEYLYNIYLKKRFWNNLNEKYNKEKEQLIKFNKKIAFDYLVGICKVYQFKKIQEYNEKMKCSIALKRLFIPFIKNKFRSFIKRNKFIHKLKNFKNVINSFLRKKILLKLLKYYADLKHFSSIILTANQNLQKIILKKYFEKIKNTNINNNYINMPKKRSYLSGHFDKEDNKANSYIYESLDCEDSISVHPNSVDNDGLHQLKEIIEMQNENRYDDSATRPENSFNDENSMKYLNPYELIDINNMNNKKSGNNIDSLVLNNEENEKRNETNPLNENKIKTEIHLKEHLLQQIINTNETSSKDNKKEISNNEISIKQNKEKENLILTKINDEKENKNKINDENLINSNISNSIKNSNEDIINIIENNNSNEMNDITSSNEINVKNLENLNEIKSKIKDKNKFADELTEYIISNILIGKELKSPTAKLLPRKAGDFNYQKYNDFNLQSLMNNNNISESNLALDSLANLSLSDYSQNSSQILEKSMIFQYTISSEFNKTIKERKNLLETNLYNDYIIDKLILLICKEIKQNYSRIYENISIPYKANYEQVIVASYLQDNELLNNSYKELKVKEDLKNIINKKKIIEKFNSINRKIRKLKGLEDNNNYDNLINECIVDATIEILNKERPYGETGEPFPFSKREGEISFKYNKNDPKPLMKHVYKSLKKMLFEKGNIIKENSPIFDKNDPFLMNIFKKEMENENIWNELEIQEEQVKSLASNIIFDQLINEIIEILEHVQLNRKKPELYQNKSIYACDEIPRLGFQMASNFTENDETEGDVVLSN